MPTTRIKEKISTLVNSQLPEFIRSDYTTFVTFIEAYYKFLEQDQGALEIVQNARAYNDIDSTTASFINYFLANYAQDIPLGVLANKNLLIKKIKNLYESKGSEISFKLLFLLLYNEPVEVSYPYENVLIASGGEWEQKTTIRVTLLSGSVSNISDRYLVLNQNGQVYRTSIINVKFLTTNLYELTLEHNEVAPYEIGSTVTVSNATSVIFTGIVSGTTTGYSIPTPGTGFTVAQIFNINVGDAIGTQLQVLQVDANGGISKLRILSYGYNYNSNISVILDPNSSVATYAQAKRSRTLGFVDTIIFLGNYGGSDPNRYFDSDYNTDAVINYNANVLSSTSTTVSVSPGITEGLVSPTFATVNLTIGAIARYPGTYVSNKGFLSDDVIRLQDEKQYQPFAYRTESTLEFSKFQDIITKLIHPAGQRLFNNRVLTNTINAVANVSVITSSNVFLELRDVILISDAVTVAGLYLATPDYAIMLETALISTQRSLTDNVDVTEISTLNITKLITDNVTILDISTSINEASRLLDDMFILENITLNVTLAKADSVSITEVLSAITLNYDAEQYFSEVYVGGAITITAV